MTLVLLSIVNYIFTAYVYVLLIRFFLQKMGTSWHNPVTRFVVVMTEKPLKPLRYIFPGFRGFDLAIIVLALIVIWVEDGLLIALNLQIYTGLLSLLVTSMGELLQNLVNLFLFVTIISAVLSWFPQMQRSPVALVVTQLSNPLRRWVSKWLPPIGGFDLSPIIIILLLMLFQAVIVNRIILFGITL